MLVDSRLGFTELDRNLLEFVAPRVGNGSVKLLVLLTKADKLSRRELDDAAGRGCRTPWRRCSANRPTSASRRSRRSAGRG